MLTRLATGFVLAPLLIWLLVSGPLWSIHVVIVAAGALAARELIRMFSFVERRDVWLATVFSGVVAAAPLMPVKTGLALLLVVNAIVLALTLRRPGALDVAAQRAAMLVLSISYVGAMAGALNGIVLMQELKTGGPEIVFGLSDIGLGRGALITLFIIVFAGDTGAYFAGRAFGRHKLNELISPKKTWEGTVGGLLASMLSAYGCAHYVLFQVPPVEAAVVGLACGGFAQIGDLTESLFKRATGTKDSGALLPGHGGMFDRIDGVLFGAPVFWAYLLLVK